jgi:hypothetical protein
MTWGWRWLHSHTIKIWWLRFVAREKHKNRHMMYSSSLIWIISICWSLEYLKLTTYILWKYFGGRGFIYYKSFCLLNNVFVQSVANKVLQTELVYYIFVAIASSTEMSKDDPYTPACRIILGKKIQPIPSNWVFWLLSGVDRRCVCALS